MAFDPFPGGAKYKVSIVFELEGEEKPACVAEFIAMAYTHRHNKIDMGVALDKAKAVRKGEQLNEQALQDYLRKSLGKEQVNSTFNSFPQAFPT